MIYHNTTKLTKTILYADFMSIWQYPTCISDKLNTQQNGVKTTYFNEIRATHHKLIYLSNGETQERTSP